MKTSWRLFSFVWFVSLGMAYAENSPGKPSEKKCLSEGKKNTQGHQSPAQDCSEGRVVSAQKVNKAHEDVVPSSKQLESRRKSTRKSVASSSHVKDVDLTNLSKKGTEDDLLKTPSAYVPSAQKMISSGNKDPFEEKKKELKDKIYSLMRARVETFLPCTYGLTTPEIADSIQKKWKLSADSHEEEIAQINMLMEEYVDINADKKGAPKSAKSQLSKSSKKRLSRVKTKAIQREQEAFVNALIDEFVDGIHSTVKTWSDEVLSKHSSQVLESIRVTADIVKPLAYLYKTDDLDGNQKILEDMAGKALARSSLAASFWKSIPLSTYEEEVGAQKEKLACYVVHACLADVDKNDGLFVWEKKSETRGFKKSLSRKTKE